MAKPLKNSFIIFMDSMNCIDGVLLKGLWFVLFLLSDQIQFMWYFISVSVSLSNLYKGVYDSNIGISVEHLVEARLSIHQLQLVKLLVILEQRRQTQSERPCPEKSIN